VGIVALVAFGIACGFLDIWDMVIDTIFQCYCMDEEYGTGNLSLCLSVFLSLSLARSIDRSLARSLSLSVSLSLSLSMSLPIACVCMVW
jgi:hypothetical protein